MKTSGVSRASAARFFMLRFCEGIANMSKIQFQEDGYENIYNLYRKGVLVECPRCRECAYVTPPSEVAARITCGACGHSKELENESGWSSSDEVRYGRDHYSKSQLWLQVRCCDERLWALNREHVEWLEGYVGADLRSRDIGDGCINSCLNSRIPKWMSSKKNRQQVLAGIEKLKARLP